MVYRSSTPCVGCAWRPSPAFTTCSCGFTCRAMRNGAPEDAWRTTKMSACMAERFATVSRSDSPLVWDESAILRLMTSAESRFAAISKVVRVRVEGSKNRLKTLLPRSSGTFFTSRSVTPTNDSAVSRIWPRISRGRPSMESRCCSSPWALSCGLRCTAWLQRERELAVRFALEAKAHARRHVEARAAVLGADRQLAAAAIGEHHERDARRPPVIEELVHGGAHRAAGVEHIVDEQQLAPVDVERNLGALRIVVQPLGVIVVAVESDVHQAERRRKAKERVQPLGEPGAAGIAAGHRRARRKTRAQLSGELLAELLGVRQLHGSIARAEAVRRRRRRAFASRRAAGSAPPPS